MHTPIIPVPSSAGGLSPLFAISLDAAVCRMLQRDYQCTLSIMA